MCVRIAPTRPFTIPPPNPFIMNPKTILASLGIICAVASMVFTQLPLLAVAVIFIGVAVLVP